MKKILVAFCVLMIMGAGVAFAVVLSVDIDIKPWSDPNSINLKSSRRTTEKSILYSLGKN